MKIITLIKQVPATTAVEMDKKTGVLKRGKEKGKLNPFDLFAIEISIEIAKMTRGSVIAATMGPAAAEESLREAIYMGVDDAYLITDMAFAGSDVLATSRTLAEAIKMIGKFDIIVCGKQTTDGDTAQVGAETAEWLGIPHMNNVVKIQELSNEGVSLVVETEQELSTVYIPIPCLISVDKDINTPRLPSYIRKKSLNKKEIKKITLKDFPNSDPSDFGMDGSPTKVVRVFEPEIIVKSERIEGTADEVAKQLDTVLREERFI